MTESIDRRGFLKKSAAAGFGLSVAGHLSAVRGMAAPNEKIVVAVMGVNSRGNALARSFASVDGSEVAYIVDVDRRAIRETVADVSEIQDVRPEGVVDFRNVLEDDDLDALVIATPDHWHTPASILAMKAGKHVYVEKPCSHNAREGELLVEAQKKFGKVVQMGNGRRSNPRTREAIAALHDGIIGPVHNVRCWYARNRGDIGSVQRTSVPDWLDWELWQGPAPRKSYSEPWVHYDWHWFWHWGTAEAGNNGVHTLDLARWGLDVDYPVRVTAAGGTHVHENWETPDNQMLSYEFDSGKLATWEGISYNRMNTYGASNGVMFQGSEGSLLIPGDSYIVFDGDGNKVEEVGSETEERQTSLTGELDYPHVENFLNAIRTGEEPHSEIEGGHKSTMLCHLANISHRLGRPVHCDPSDGHIVGDEEAMQMWSREYEPGWEPTV